MTDTKNEMNAIFKKYELVVDKHVFYNQEQDYTIFTRLGILKIIKAESINITYDIYFHEKLIVVKATGQRQSKDPFSFGPRVESFGEASPENNDWKYPVAIAQKRAQARVVIEMVFEEFEEKVMGEVELAPGDRDKLNKGELIVNNLITKRRK